MVKKRILVIDDNLENLALYRDILAPETAVGSAELNALEFLLFNRKVITGDELTFILDLESSGEVACQHLQDAYSKGDTYDLAFVDMCMPGGWSGLETIGHLWQHDPDLPVVICSAYSDYNWEEITQRLGHANLIKILNKPFERQQVLGLAQSFSA
ncbi:response regulator [Iodobacter sp.]|uniref:response regulator n=1 Tax=Iodobacter sp. TaxID=1915058 RepID=UPI0025F638CC|nr:response regulator [Iodobacter sp.]